MTAREITELTGYVFRSGYVQIETESLFEKRNDLISAISMEDEEDRANTVVFYRKKGTPTYHSSHRLSDALCSEARTVIFIRQRWTDIYTQGCNVAIKRMQQYYVNIYRK